jgi:phage host-nuclease inhibitor protein Gam
MTKPVTAHPNRGIRIDSVKLVHSTAEIDEYSFQTGMLNVLSGPRNSSKTTTLKVIDYCLGDRGGMIDALGAAVADEYVEVSTTIRLNGHPHTLTRLLQQGRMNKVYVDGDELTDADFSDWILRELGWPNLRIPKGLHPATATELTPLSFRNLLRHFYRNEESWTSFANKEQEFIRRGVVSMLLGFARTRYDTKEFALAQAKRRLAEAQAVERDVLDSTLQAVTAISERLRIPLARTLDQVATARAEVTAQLDAVRQRRQELTSEINSLLQGTSAPETTAGYDSSLTSAYEDISRQLQQAVDEVVALEQLESEHTYSAQTVTSEVTRMERLIASVEIFDALPVRLCPACEQRVDPHREHGADACYLCFQPVDDDQRRRRAQVEIRSLKSELADLDDVITRTAAELQTARTRRAELQEEQGRLAHRINEERAAQLAPFMASLENLAAEVARLEQKMTAFPAIEEILQRRVVASQAVTSAQQALDELGEEGAAVAETALSPIERCAVFAERMNEFLHRYRERGWVKGGITINDSDLTFYVGTRPWDQALGAETKVLFFLAYSYATLFLASDLDKEAASPGLLLLDNPYQQGIDATVVDNVLHDLATAARATGTQIISTQAVPTPRDSATIREIHMPREYETP